MHAAAGASHQFLYLPMRRWLIRLLGHRSVQALEEVADASSEVTSTTRSSSPLIPQPRLRSLLMERMRSRPDVYAQVAQLAAQAAQDRADRQSQASLDTTVTEVEEDVELPEEVDEELSEPEKEEELDIEISFLFATPPAVVSPPHERATEGPRRPASRRSRRPTSEGGSPLAGGLPYTGRRFCEYN